MAVAGQAALQPSPRHYQVHLALAGHSIPVLTARHAGAVGQRQGCPVRGTPAGMAPELACAWVVAMLQRGFIARLRGWRHGVSRCTRQDGRRTGDAGSATAVVAAAVRGLVLGQMGAWQGIGSTLSRMCTTIVAGGMTGAGPASERRREAGKTAMMTASRASAAAMVKTDGAIGTIVMTRMCLVAAKPAGTTVTKEKFVAMIWAGIGGSMGGASRKLPTRGRGDVVAGSTRTSCVQLSGLAILKHSVGLAGEHKLAELCQSCL
jgi:hypothetical protein